MNRSLNRIAATGTKRVIRHLRWWVLVLFLAGVTVNYITRNSLGILAPELKTSLGITTEQYSWIVGAFQLAYTFFQPICGWLIDVIGLKLGLICATIWALACLFHAGAASWLRFVMGGAEAAATPANAKVIGEWFPKRASSRLGRRRLLDWRYAGASHHLLCPRLVRLAGRIPVYRLSGSGLGGAVVAVVSRSGT